MPMPASSRFVSHTSESPHQFQLELLRLLFTVRLHVQMNLAGLALCRLSLGGPGSVVPSTIHF